jgi:hypothetical protein
MLIALVIDRNRYKQSIKTTIEMAGLALEQHCPTFANWLSAVATRELKN